MAAIAKRTSPAPSMCSSNPPQHKQTKGTAGEALGECDQVALETDGLYYKAISGTAARARVRGQNRFPCSANEPCTITKGLRYEYTGTAGTPGADVFLSGTTAGGLDTVVSNAIPAVGFFLEDGKRIEFFEPR